MLAGGVGGGLDQSPASMRCRPDNCGVATIVTPAPGAKAPSRGVLNRTSVAIAMTESADVIASCLLMSKRPYPAACMKDMP